MINGGLLVLHGVWPFTVKWRDVKHDSVCVCVCIQVWIEFGRIKLPQGLHPNDLEEEWGKLILEMLEREKALRPAVERYTNTVTHTQHTHAHEHRCISYFKNFDATCVSMRAYVCVFLYFQAGIAASESQ